MGSGPFFSEATLPHSNGVFFWVYWYATDVMGLKRFLNHDLTRWVCDPLDILSASRPGVQVAAADPTQAALAATAPGADAAAAAAAAAADPNQLAALGVWFPRIGLWRIDPAEMAAMNVICLRGALCEVFVFAVAGMFVFLTSNYI